MSLTTSSVKVRVCNNWAGFLFLHLKDLFSSPLRNKTASCGSKPYSYSIFACVQKNVLNSFPSWVLSFIWLIRMWTSPRIRGVANSHQTYNKSWRIQCISFLSLEHNKFWIKQTPIKAIENRQWGCGREQQI